MVLLAYARPGPREPVTVGLRILRDSQEQTVWLHAGEDGISASRSGDSADVTISGPVTALLGLMSRSLSVRDALADGTISAEGDSRAAEVAERFFDAF